MGIFLRKLAILFSLLLVIFVSTGTQTASAGFGVTPPYVKNTSLVRNSTYQQQILLVRGDPNVAQKAEIKIDAPELEGWLEIVEGAEIQLPRGEQKIPMTVKVTVPDDAEFKTYTGAIRVRTVPADGLVAPGAVSISLGARIDIELSVIDREIRDFRVRRVAVSELNEGTKLGWLYFPGKIVLKTLVENIGNVDHAPTRAEVSIYNRSGDVLLEETRNIGKIKKVAPYQTEEVDIEVPTRLPAGNYMLRYKIFNGDDMRQQGDMSLTILPAGTLQTAGFGFNGLSIPHKISVLLPIFSIVIIVLYILYSRKRKHV